MTKMGHTEMTIVGISNKRKIGRLYKVHQLLPILKKPDKLEYLIGNMNHFAHIIPPAR